MDQDKEVGPTQPATSQPGDGSQARPATSVRGFGRGRRRVFAASTRQFYDATTNVRNSSPPIECSPSNQDEPSKLTGGNSSVKESVLPATGCARTREQGEDRGIRAIVGQNRPNRGRHARRNFQPSAALHSYQNESQENHNSRRYNRNQTTSRRNARFSVQVAQQTSVSASEQQNNAQCVQGEETGQASATNSLPSEHFKPVQPRRFIRDRGAQTTTSSNQQDTPADIQSGISENQLKSNTFECMICCDNIHRAQPIWYCNNCYNIFHLKCSIEWCNKSIKSRDEAIANAQYPSLGSATNSFESQIAVQSGRIGPSSFGGPLYQQERMSSVEWPCPACREILHSRPGKYKCFCGKVVRPEINRHLTPHSCGQLCGRKRPSSDCPHSCNTICHPGRCNPCQLTSRKSCFCGKKVQEVKCSVEIGTCDQTCDKTLSCGRHNCTKTCHNANCERCKEIVIVTCHCGAESVQKFCDELLVNKDGAIKRFSCGKICGTKLDCGIHICEEKCHPGPNCSSCKFLNKNLKTCSCGATKIDSSLLADRNCCTDPIPTCGNKCNRLLICGPEKTHHKCQKKCHSGSCPPCKLKTPTRCECGQSTKTIECSLMFEKITIDSEVIHFRQNKYSFKCETKCVSLKNCGRHRCQSKCCTAGRDPNSLVHKCDQVCNRKLACRKHNCTEPCHQGSCGDCPNIGWNELACHCGNSILYPPIPCNAKRPVCHRPCRRAHNCGHPVKHECHDDSEKCAPCIVFVRRSCFCGAESKDSVHCYQAGYSCGKTCKKLLGCRQHTCKRVCHDNECEPANDRGFVICSQPCPVARFTCKHPCGLPCHGKSMCPPSECKKVLEISCDCGNRTDRIECHKLSRDLDNRNKVAMLSMHRSNQDSIMVDLTKKPAAEPSGRRQLDNSAQTKKLDCDETCSIFKRNKALAEALEIAQPDLKPTSVFGEDPLRLLKEATAHDYKSVASTYNSLVKLVELAKESDKRFLFLKFAPADRLRREVVHELAHHFNCTSESQGEEPLDRHVVVRAYRNKSSVPEFTIEQLLPVEE